MDKENKAPDTSTCVAKTLGKMQKGIKFLENAFSVTKSFTDSVNNYISMPGISKLTSALGPIGMGINLGVKIINSLVVIAEKGLAKGI